MLRFIHCADLHLDSPFKGIAAMESDIAAKLQQAPVAALEAIVELALRENVDFVLIAGDAWDVQEKSLPVQLQFNSRMRQLEERNIPCYYACGNHDPLPGGREAVKLPDNVRRFGKQVSMFTFEKNGSPAAHIYGVSFSRAAENENLALKFSRRDPAQPAIAVLHCNVGDTGHENYAPCSIDDLVNAGMDYWALGHVHQFRVLRQQTPAIVYPGCAQGCNPRETGPHGCCLVTINDDGGIQTEFRAIDSIRYETIDLSVEGLTDWEALIDRVAEEAGKIASRLDGRDLMLRCNLSGKTLLDPELRQEQKRDEARNAINDRLAGDGSFIRIERLTAATHGTYDLDELAKDGGFIAETIELYRHIDSDAELRREIDDVVRKFCGEPCSDEEFRTACDSALDMTINLLAEGE